jgi:hypothetical protein
MAVTPGLRIVLEVLSVVLQAAMLFEKLIVPSEVTWREYAAAPGKIVRTR